MAGVDQIIETIVSRANEQIREIEQNCEQRCAYLWDQANADLEEQRVQIRRTTGSRLEEIDRRTNTMVSLGMRRERLAVKRDIVDSLFDECLDQLCALPQEDYEKLIVRFMEQAATGGEVVEGDGRITPALMERINRALADKGVQEPLTLSPDRANIRGGFILKKDGVLTNCSFEMTVRQMRTQMEGQIAARLFEDGAV